jgi:HAD superfamily hydrolase (TIGR01549 family)
MIMKKEEKNLLIFDFDGTIVDTMKEYTEIAGEVISKIYNIPKEVAMRKYIETSGIPFCKQLVEIFGDDERNKIAEEEFEKRKVKALFSKKISETTKKVLKTLKQRGYFLALSSGNTEDNIVKFLEREKVYFDVVCGYKENFEKGEKHFDYIIRKLNIPKEKTYFIGDSLKDAEKSINFSIHFIALLSLFSKNEFEERFKNHKIIYINNIEELLEIFP